MAGSPAVLLGRAAVSETVGEVIGLEATATTNRALIEECVEERVWAVVGASTDPARWGYRIYRALFRSGKLEV